MSADVQNYVIDETPGGPVGLAFMNARPRGAGGGAGVLLIDGPVGSAKTTTCFLTAFKMAREAPRSPIDGKRRCKLAVVRETYPRLHANVIPSWFKRFPKELGKWTGADNRPSKHFLKLGQEDGSELLLTVHFFAIGDKSVEEALRGFEPTIWYLNELDTLPEEVLAFASGRAGRYPDMMHGGPGWFGVIGDFNKTYTGHWLHRYVHDLPEGAMYFSQPSGLSPRAENVPNLPPGYYQSQAALNKHRPNYVRRMVLNEWGVPEDQAAVYPEWSELRHLAAGSLLPDPDLDLIIGADAGRRPALVCGQWDPVFAQWRVLRELTAENMGAPSFAELANRFIAREFRGFRVERMQAWGDPASANLTESADQSWMAVMRARTGIRFRPAPGANNLELRIGAVSQVLRSTGEQGVPGFVLDPSCERLRRGFNGAYAFAVHKVGGGLADILSERPVKNASSHPHDALQNLILGGGGAAELYERKRGLRAASAPVIAPATFDPLVLH